MPTESITVVAIIPADPERIWRAWLTGSEHAAMTGGAATGEPRVGTRYTAWDDYIEGTNLELEQGRRIVQSWRSTEFPEGAPDSRLELILESHADGTRVTLIHSEIPEGQGASYESGWSEHYFEPMKAYFSDAPTPATGTPIFDRPTRKVPVQGKAEKAAKKAKKKVARKAAPKKAKARAKKAAGKKKGRKGRR